MTREEAEAAGWEFTSDDSAEKLLSFRGAHPATFVVSGADILRQIDELEQRAASNDHHANLYA